jgi:magnesium and cobalt exporter, CNNM family
MLIAEIILVLALFVLNGFFAMAELAIVSSRRAHLERLAKEGRPGAQVALALADDPARMLAAVQIGFTTTATLAGIFSGATLKHIALNNPEPIAIRVARPLALVARAAAPVIWLLNASTRLFLRLLHLRPRFERDVTEEDIHYLVAEGARTPPTVLIPRL